MNSCFKNYELGFLMYKINSYFLLLFQRGIIITSRLYLVLVHLAIFQVAVTSTVSDLHAESYAIIRHVVGTRT